MNISYAPYLPADEEGSATIDNYIRMLDKKYSLDPLIRALEISERNSMSYEELPSGIVRQISVRYRCFSFFLQKFSSFVRILIDIYPQNCVQIIYRKLSF